MNQNHTNSSLNSRGEPAGNAQDLGARIRKLRIGQGLSQEMLAERLDVSRQAVAKWERGTSLPSTANLLALSRIFGCSVSELTGTPQEAEQTPAGQAISPGQDPISEPRNNPPHSIVFAGVVLLVLAAVLCLAAAIGTLLVCLVTPAASVGVIGSADGPTSIWVAGPDISGVIFSIAALILGVILLVCAVRLWRRRR